MIRDTLGPLRATPVTQGRRDDVEGRAPSSSPALGAWPLFSVETFRPVEIKHAIYVQSFHGMQGFHVVAACGTVAPRRPGT